MYWNVLKILNNICCILPIIFILLKIKDIIEIIYIYNCKKLI